MGNAIGRSPVGKPALLQRRIHLGSVVGRPGRSGVRPYGNAFYGGAFCSLARGSSSAQVPGKYRRVPDAGPERELKPIEMNNQTHPNRLLRSSLSLAMALAVWAPIPAHSAEHAAGGKMTSAKMMEQCQEMKDQKAKLKADIKSYDVQLTEQVAAMNRAPDDKKTALIAAVLTQMTEQRIAMGERQAKIEEEMMEHMSQHMGMGRKSMTKCPMMKGMKAKKGEHGKHHDDEK